jgi:spore coat protein U-like protein
MKGQRAMKRLLIAATACLGVVVAQDVWAAQTTTTTLAVSASVDSTCSVTASTLAFLTVHSGASVTNANATVNVTCTSGATYDVGLDPGTHAISSQRYLAGATPTNTLMYNLYSDSGFSVPWGNTVNTDTIQGTGSGSAQVLTVYGQIPGSQAPATDVYNDVVTITVSY